MWRTYTAVMKRSTQHGTQFRSVADAMRALDLTDAEVAKIVGCDRSRITRIRGGAKFACLRTPLRLSRALRVPIENLADADAA